MEVRVILAHGSKRQDTKEIMNSIVEKVKRKTGWEKVYPAYLQLCEPSLDQVIEEVVDENVTKLVVMPMFLFNGEHVKKDIPDMLEEVQKKYTNVKIELKGFIGDDDRVADIVIDRINK